MSGLLAAFWAIVVLAWSEREAPAGYLVSFDDVFRLLLAVDVRNGDLVPSDVWPPLQSWIFSVAVWVWPDVTVLPRVLNVLASAGTLLALDRVAFTLGMSGTARLATGLSLGLLPTFVWIAPSALVEPMTLCASAVALLGVVRWAGGESAGLRVAFGGLAVAGLFRYEPWAWAAALAIVCTRAPHFGLSAPGWKRRARWALVFPVLWCGYALITAGNPAYFAGAAHEFYQEDQVSDGLLPRAGAALVGLVTAVGVLALPGAIGLSLRWTRPAWRVVIASAVGIAGLQFLAHLLGLAGLHTLWRHYLPVALALSLGVGALVDRVRPPAARPGLALLVAALLVASTPLLSLSRIAAGLDTLAVRLRAEQSRLGGVVLIEAVGFDSHVLQVLSGRVSDVRFDRVIEDIPLDRPATTAERESNPSRLSGRSARVAAWLAEEDVRLLVLRSTDAQRWARGHTRRLERVGDWVLLEVEGP